MKLKTKAFLLAFSGTCFVATAAIVMTFTPNDAESGSTAANARTNAIIACRDSVRENAAYPSSATFFLFTTETGFDEQSGSFVIRGRVDLMNGFGAMIPHTYSCLVNRNHATSLISITPGA